MKVQSEVTDRDGYRDRRHEDAVEPTMLSLVTLKLFSLRATTTRPPRLLYEGLQSNPLIKRQLVGKSVVVTRDGGYRGCCMKAQS